MSKEKVSENLGLMSIPMVFEYATLFKLPLNLNPPIKPSLSTGLNWKITGTMMALAVPVPTNFVDREVVPGT
jgi:hypothetical protein